MKFSKSILVTAVIFSLWMAIPYSHGEATLTTLVSFNGSNGTEPWSALVQADDGYFYGTASFGGAYGAGTVFKMTPVGVMTTLHSFDLQTEGGVPQAGLILARDGNLYGTTRDAASPYLGTIFKITTNGSLTTLAFFNGTNGAWPWAGQLFKASDGLFYGTTANGGIALPPNGNGTVFRVTPAGEVTSLHVFSFVGGYTPYGGLIEAVDGNLYGTTAWGGAAFLSSGTIFRITKDGNLSTLVSFTGRNGILPFSALFQAPDTTFYGTTTQGGASYGDSRSVNRGGFGTIFKMTAQGAFTSLFSFQGTNGSYPYTTLVPGNDGNLYGTTLSGGAFTNELFSTATGYAGYGTIFRITANGVLTTLASFASTNGAEPIASLTLGRDGRLYGTTILGGAHNLGTVFRLGTSSPPAITCPTAATVECGPPAQVTVDVSDADGQALTVIWNVNGQPLQTNTVPAGSPTTIATVSLQADFPLGTNVINVSVMDTDLNTASCSTTINVVDTIPPRILSAIATPGILWPPDHRMVTIRLSARLDDDCGPTTWKIIDVRSNESVNGRGDGNTTPDWIITGDKGLQLRAERSGNGAGRVYSIILQASDSAGNSSQTVVVTVKVPKSQTINSRELRSSGLRF